MRMACFSYSWMDVTRQRGVAASPYTMQISGQGK
jgi:hypothetical protein